MQTRQQFHGNRAMPGVGRPHPEADLRRAVRFMLEVAQGFVRGGFSAPSPRLLARTPTEES
jgi:hypothetical protein